MRRSLVVLGVVLVLALIGGGTWFWAYGDGTGGWFSYSSRGTPAPTVTVSPTGGARRLPLAGKVVVIDPGHQLGNSRHPAQINRLVDAGGFMKPCNTTGTATDAGFPEATFNWRVALDVRRILRAKGARVVLTRRTNSLEDWGPCVDVRGRIGNPGRPGPTANVKLSIHADGSYAEGAHGFHVISPAASGRTRAIAPRSRLLARTVRDRMVAAGFATSSYRGVHGLDVRGDLGTLNWSRRPVVMIECGNMRDRHDAAVLTSSSGQHRIAAALAAALQRFLLR